ncbi:hypothetical protein GCM10007937_27710 [Mesorhizobium albiziae]|nr:hypothetical protein GCM10007937_27710 [Mesorhizobium albiziae]
MHRCSRSNDSHAIASCNQSTPDGAAQRDSDVHERFGQWWKWLILAIHDGNLVFRRNRTLLIEAVYDSYPPGTAWSTVSGTQGPHA